jgi:hypothetical protein
MGCAGQHTATGQAVPSCSCASKCSLWSGILTVLGEEAFLGDNGILGWLSSERTRDLPERCVGVELTSSRGSGLSARLQPGSGAESEISGGQGTDEAAY